MLISTAARFITGSAPGVLADFLSAALNQQAMLWRTSPAATELEEVSGGGRHGRRLVDDLVDSRWTLTVAGSLLREEGSGPVFPFALAVATPRGE